MGWVLKFAECARKGEMRVRCLARFEAKNLLRLPETIPAEDAIYDCRTSKKKYRIAPCLYWK